MVFGIPEMILLVLLVLIPIFSLRNWADMWARYRRGQPLVPAARRDTVPWGLIDLAAIVVFLGLFIGVGVTAIRAWAGVEDVAELDQLSPNDQSIVFAAFGTASLLAILCSFAWISWRLRATPAQMGLSRQWLGADVNQGVQWFTMLVVPVLLLQWLLTHWIPTRHPLIEMLQKSGNPSFLLVAAYAAVIAAPLCEEALFRLFLQGWLEKLQITLRRNRTGLASQEERAAVLMGTASRPRLELPDDRSSGPEAFPAEGIYPPENGATENPENPLAAGSQLDERDSGKGPPGDAAILWTPILVSSGLFSIAHMSHGPDLVPLFFLALGLGYLYQRTGRIQPCIVVHMLVNAVAILQLWAAVRQPA